MTYFIMTITTALALLFSFTSHNAYAQKSNDHNAPIVVELFTSQGCSSCPPADKILGALSQNENIITLGCHVRYWDRPEWKDTLSHDYCDMRQHGYAGLKNSKRVYTPQMIVNGKDEFVGSHSSKVKAALKRAQDNPIQAITLKADASTIQFTLPAVQQASYRIWAYGYKNNVYQSIGNGENSGRKVTYTTPVNSYTNLGSWNGDATIHSFEKPAEDIDGIAILAQKNGYGEIVAAGKLQF